MATNIQKEFFHKFTKGSGSLFYSFQSCLPSFLLLWSSSVPTAAAAIITDPVSIIIGTCLLAQALVRCMNKGKGKWEIQREIYSKSTVDETRHDRDITMVTLSAGRTTLALSCTNTVDKRGKKIQGRFLLLLGFSVSRRNLRLKNRNMFLVFGWYLPPIFCQWDLIVCVNINCCFDRWLCSGGILVCKYSHNHLFIWLIISVKNWQWQVQQKQLKWYKQLHQTVLFLNMLSWLLYCYVYLECDLYLYPEYPLLWIMPQITFI